MDISITDKALRAKRRQEAITLHEIEGYTFTDEQNAMFEMFDRENFTDEQRRDYILSRAKARAGKTINAAE